ncbi:MAG: polyprenyl synthetase family protein [Polyangiaceae bacterium]|nr:polyprenyl synthetase family protein [Polyangiaceae bacterium]
MAEFSGPFSAESVEDRGAFFVLLSAVQRDVDRALATWLKPRVAAAAQIGDDVLAAAEAVEHLALRGGKRMRAALIAAAYASCQKGASSHVDDDNTRWAGALLAMVAIELLQVYLLIHDDWMDDDEVRRGGPAVHVVLRNRLGTKRLGDVAAILAGDLACGYAQAALLETTLPAEHVLRAARAFAQIQQDVVKGQIAEMHSARRSCTPSTSPCTSVDATALPSVETIHSLKTASYTVTGPLVVGALLAGANDARVAELERFGRPLGIAFQLRDDLLGVFGNPALTGKPIWNDLRQGKRTALVDELRDDAAAQIELARVLGNANAQHGEIEALVHTMEASGARARVEARLQELLGEARRALGAMSFSWGTGDMARAWLSGATFALGERST